MFLDHNTKLFLILWLAVFFSSSIIYCGNNTSNIKYIRDLDVEKVCITNKEKEDRVGFIYNDSLLLGNYFIDYHNRHKKDMLTNELSYRLRPGTCLLLTEHASDSLYLIEGEDTILFINLYNASRWSIFN